MRFTSRALMLAGIAAAGCGGATVAATTAAAPKNRYATSPTSAKPVNPKAVPLGDGYVSRTPRVGYVDSCITHFGSGIGAQTEGPWIHGKAWDYKAKLAVGGSVSWPTASYSVRASGGKRVITFNDLPINHTTGIFPIRQTDPAFAYDHNSNHIAAQSLNWSLPLHPRAASSPSCTNGGPIGVLSDGVVLYNALDGQGRDAAAHEVLDRCAGHPDPSRSYHHHDIPPCILKRARNGHATLVGFALDGYGIYVVKSRTGALPSNPALDRCHGTTSKVLWNGRRTRVYHYVATLEYPYTVGCFHGSPITITHGGPPGGGGPPGP